jgi:hypothetical protein
MNAGESLRDQAAFEPLSAPGSTAPPPKIAASGALEGDALLKQKERGPSKLAIRLRAKALRRTRRAETGGKVVAPSGAPLPSLLFLGRVVVRMSGAKIRARKR